jgi:hypothetical protein
LGGSHDSQPITLVGAGRRLIRDTLTTSVERRDLEQIVLDGFFPLVDPGSPLMEGAKKGITEFGLPYAQDPSVTRHMVRFLIRHREDLFQVLGKEIPRPDLILFNGGSLKPKILQERIREAVQHWFQEEDPKVPRVLINSDLELAVARGASYYGLVRKGYGVRVGSGSPRAYYLGVEKAWGEEPSGGRPEAAVCLVERGMEEGRRVELRGRHFEVLANQPVSFDLYSSSYRSGDRLGDLVPVDDSLTPLPPLRTVIQFGKKAGETRLPIQMEAHYTELGTLALWCRSLRTEHRWRLQFQVRRTGQAGEPPDQEIFEEEILEEVLDRVREAFSYSGPGSAPETLVRDIAELVKRPKEKWPLSLIRRTADDLIPMASIRTKSPGYESRWLNLAGFCLRPGFGDVLDEHRIQKLWKIYPSGPLHERDTQVRCEWWVLWRRVAGGLNAKQQQVVLQGISSLLQPKKKAGGRKRSPQEGIELWMALASLELIQAQDKSRWGRGLLSSLSPKKARPQHWWALSRIGAREPFYGPVDRVVPPSEVSGWIREILQRPWRNPQPVGNALIHMARRTGDRNRDLDAALVEEVIAWLNPREWPDPLIRPLREVVPIEIQEESAIFGESLPAGLVLHL